MTRAELRRALFERSVQALVLYMMRERPVGRLTNEQEIAAQERYREIAERLVSEWDRAGLFLIGAERVA